MLELTLTGGELAAINLIATTLQRAREKLIKSGLIDTANTEVQEHGKVIDDVVTFTEMTLPMYLIDEPNELHEITLAVDVYTLGCLTRVLQKSIDESASLLVSGFVEAQAEDNVEKSIALMEQHLENMNFYMILQRALLRVTAALTGSDDYPQLH